MQRNRLYSTDPKVLLDDEWYRSVVSARECRIQHARAATEVFASRNCTLHKNYELYDNCGKVRLGIPSFV